MNNTWLTCLTPWDTPLIGELQLYNQKGQLKNLIVVAIGKNNSNDSIDLMLTYE